MHLYFIHMCVWVCVLAYFLVGLFVNNLRSKEFGPMSVWSVCPLSPTLYTIIYYITITRYMLVFTPTVTVVAEVCCSVVTDIRYIYIYTDVVYRPRHPDVRWCRSLPKVAVTVVSHVEGTWRRSHTWFWKSLLLQCRYIVIVQDSSAEAVRIAVFTPRPIQFVQAAETTITRPASWNCTGSACCYA